MTRSRRGAPPRYSTVVRELMREEGWNAARVSERSLALGRPISTSTVARVCAGIVEPNHANQAALAAALSHPERDQKITATQIFGNRPLPPWAAEIVNGTAVAA